MFSPRGLNHHELGITHPRFDVECQTFHQDVPVRRDNRYALKFNLFGFDDLTPALQNYPNPVSISQSDHSTPNKVVLTPRILGRARAANQRFLELALLSVRHGFKQSRDASGIPC